MQHLVKAQHVESTRIFCRPASAPLRSGIQRGRGAHLPRFFLRLSHLAHKLPRLLLLQLLLLHHITLPYWLQLRVVPLTPLVCPPLQLQGRSRLQLPPLLQILRWLLPMTFDIYDW